MTRPVPPVPVNQAPMTRPPPPPKTDDNKPMTRPPPPPATNIDQDSKKNKKEKDSDRNTNNKDYKNKEYANQDEVRKKDKSKKSGSSNSVWEAIIAFLYIACLIFLCYECCTYCFGGSSEAKGAEGEYTYVCH